MPVVAECSTIGHHEPVPTSDESAHERTPSGRRPQRHRHPRPRANRRPARFRRTGRRGRRGRAGARGRRHPQSRAAGASIGGRAVMLSMPAAAPDIAIHKLVNVHPANPKIGLPAIHGAMKPATCCGPASTGRAWSRSAPCCALRSTRRGLRYSRASAPPPGTSRPRAWHCAGVHRAGPAAGCVRTAGSARPLNQGDGWPSRSTIACDATVCTGSASVARKPGALSSSVSVPPCSRATADTTLSPRPTPGVPRLPSTR